MSNEKTSQTCQLLSAKTLGQRLSLSKRQIHRLSAACLIPKPLKISGSIRWSEQTISDWLAAGAPDRKTFEAIQKGGNE